MCVCVCVCVCGGEGGRGAGGGKGGGNSNGFKWLSLCITSVVQSIGNLANCGVGDVFAEWFQLNDVCSMYAN